MKNSLILMAQEMCSVAISIFATAYIARCLGIADYGIFCFAIAFVALFSAFANMGLRPLTIRELARDPGNAKVYLGKIFVTRFLLSLVTVLVIIVSVNALHYPEKSVFIVYFATTGFLFGSISAIFNDAFQGFERMEFIALATFIVRIFTAVFSVLFLYMGYRLVVVAIVYAVGHFVGLLAYLFFMGRYFTLPRPEIDLTFSLKQLKQGLPFALSGLLTMLYLKIDITMLSKMSGDSAVGLYSAAANITNNLGFISGPIASAAYPAFARTHASSQEETLGIFRRCFTYLFLVGLPMAIGITLVADKVVSMMYGSVYAGSTIILQIMAWTLPFSFLVTFQAYFLQAIGMQILATTFTGVTVVLKILLNIYLIPRYGSAGAAIANVATVVAGFVCFMFIVSRRLAKPVEFAKCAVITLSGFVMGLFIVLIPWKNLLIIIPASVFIYILMLFLGGVVRKREIYFLRYLLKQ